MVGLEIQKNGKGFLKNIAKEAAKNMAKAAGQFVIDKGADFAKRKIEGMGMRKKTPCNPCTIGSIGKRASNTRC